MKVLEKFSVITSLVVKNETIVVLDWEQLRLHGFSDPNCNLWMVDESGHKKWAVNRTEKTGEPFVFLYENSTDGIRAKTFSGHEFSLNLETGQAQYLEWGGR